MEPAHRVDNHLDTLTGLIDEAANIDGLTPLELSAERALLEQLREHQDRPLRVAIIGEFSTGKSTFINAVLGQELLPARYVPTTRQLMCICHGASPGQVSLAMTTAHAAEHIADNREDVLPVSAASIEPPEALRPNADLARPLSAQAIIDLADTGQPLEIKLPIPAPWSDFHIYDTPGVNDATSMAESVIFDLMDQVDVVLMMLRAQQPLTASESDFLSHLVRHKDLDKFFFNINFCDGIPVSEATSVRAYVVETLGELRNWPMQALSERLFLCSARQSLDAALGTADPLASEHPNEHGLLLTAVHGYASARKQALLREATDSLLRFVAESAADKLSAALQIVDDEDASHGQALIEINQAITDFRVAIREEELALRVRISDRKAVLLRDVDSAFDDIARDLQDWVANTPVQMLAGDGAGKRLRMAVEERLTRLLEDFREDLSGAFQDLDQRILPMVARASARIDGIRQDFDLGPLLATTSLATAGYLVVSAALPWVLGATGVFAVTAGLASLIPGVGVTIGALLGAGAGAAASNAPQLLRGAAGGVASGYGWIRDLIRDWQEQQSRAAYARQLATLIDDLRPQVKARLDQAIDPEQITDGVLNARFPEALILEERRLLAKRLERDQLRESRQRIEALRAGFIAAIPPVRASHD
ncbi:MAG: dynamin family protein [Lamprobacter sp.]|uniref:dynamin family protein n=1 Tax=Lamprobacter sp. TaxID=3100796 RepID=UPI002B2579EF|nr:dynamin family protein [Lamprobacter sp.]MEA3640134.1 dynamin family protein [Lamprobacter sp.]